MTDDDPFSVFSDDDEEENNDQTSNTTSGPSNEIALRLIENTNIKLKDNLLSSTTTTENVASTRVEHIDVDTMLQYEQIELDWPPPLYLGPAMLVSSLEVGGGRGYVASRNLQPGTLVLVEEPAMTWPEEQLGKQLGFISIQKLLDYPTLVHHMEDFHPTKYNVDRCSYNDDGVNDPQIKKMMDDLQSDKDDEARRSIVDALVDVAKEKSITSRDGAPLTHTDIFRLFLALRYNGLETGIYRHVAMLNHDCYPNCVKLMPQNGNSYSEVRVIRPIVAGESLTISYLPYIMSHASRRRYLWEQHRFDIGANLNGTSLKLELVGNNLPKSHIHIREGDDVTSRVEAATRELQSMLDELEEEIILYLTAGVAAVASTPSNEGIWETLKALEQSTLELYHQSKEQLKNECHILLIPILMIHVESCVQLQKSPQRVIGTNIQLGILAWQIRSLRRLIELQLYILGPDHFNLASTHLDLANGIGELLSRSPQTLYDKTIDATLTTFVQWAALERKHRQEYARIKEMYPDDANDYVSKLK